MTPVKDNKLPCVQIDLLREVRSLQVKLMGYHETKRSFLEPIIKNVKMYLLLCMLLNALKHLA